MTNFEFLLRNQLLPAAAAVSPARLIIRRSLAVAQCLWFFVRLFAVDLTRRPRHRIPSQGANHANRPAAASRFFFLTHGPWADEAALLLAAGDRSLLLPLPLLLLLLLPENIHLFCEAARLAARTGTPQNS